MSSLAALALATPIFGLSLQPPDVAALSGGMPADALRAVVLAQLEADLELSGEAELDAEGDAAAQDGDEDGDEAGDEGAESQDSSDERALGKDEYKEQLRERNDLTKIHKPLGIATWAAMTATVVLGFIQYYNLYGFFADQGQNPCVQGTAIFGQDACTGMPWPHAVAAGVTTGLYAATFTVSLMMPDPDDLSSGEGEYASTLRMHKLLRWVHFGGMVAQILLGVVIANDMLGLDRASDYDTLQALATAHLGVGLVTYGALTWAGALMTF